MTWEYLYIEVPGEPVGKGRPRFNSKTHRTYTPGRTAQYENLIRLAFTEKYPNWVPVEEAVEVRIRAEFLELKSWSRKKRLIARLITVWKTTSPDIDNLTKAAFDGLNKLAWKDDAQVVKLTASKYYSEHPRLVITVRPMAETNLHLKELTVKQLEHLTDAKIQLDEEEENDG